MAGEDYSLVDGEQITEQPRTGLYPVFVEEPGATGTVDINDDVRQSLTPRFPSRIRFEVEVPPAAFLEFSPALIMVQDVRRARVEFRIIVEEGGDATGVYSEILRADVANRWHDRELDLSAWAGRAVVLIVETRAVPPRGDPLWADRVQTVWGNPVLSANPGRVFVTRVTRVARESSDWFGGQLDASGVSPHQQTMTYGFAINLLLGGLLSLAVRALYKRFATTLSNRETFANMLPLFTLATITVISVVQYSPALALGLVGALSVIRFRAAIASAEDLSYLLMCVGLGVAIGGNHLFLAAATVVILTPFIVLRGRAPGTHVHDNLILTVASHPSSFYDGDNPSVIDVVRRMTSGMTVERLDQESERVFLRARISVRNGNQLIELLAALRKRVPECQVSSLEPDPS